MKINNHDWTLSYKIESNFRYIISEQESYGWYIDQPLKIKYEKYLQNKINLLEYIIKERLPMICNKGKELKNVLKKDGTPTQAVISWYNSLDVRPFPLSSVCGSFTRLEFKVLNLNSVPQKREVLKKYGWKPTKWNYKKDSSGNVVKGVPSEVYSKEWFDKNSWHLPKDYLVTKNEYQQIVTGGSICYDEENRNIKCLISFVRHAKIRHRLSLLQGLVIREDGAVAGGGNTVACNTGRVQHRGIVNIPKAEKKVFFGKQIRSIFSHREGYILLGADLSALENRLMGHYTFNIDDGKYANRLMKEDPHTRTAEVLRITRTQAKTVNYALSFGATYHKLKEILKCSEAEAKKAYAAWWNDKAPLLILKQKLEKAVENRNPMWIKGLDGRKVFCRSKHSLLNALIQSAGSVVNKFITCCVYKEIKKNNLDAHFVLNYHDEIDLEVKNDEKSIDLLKQIVYNGVEKCNKYFQFKVPMAMDIHVGKSWAAIH